MALLANRRCAKSSALSAVARSEGRMSSSNRNRGLSNNKSLAPLHSYRTRIQDSCRFQMALEGCCPTFNSRTFHTDFALKDIVNYKLSRCVEALYRAVKNWWRKKRSGSQTGLQWIRF